MQTQLMHTAAPVDWTGSRLHINSHDMYQMQLENSLNGIPVDQLGMEVPQTSYRNPLPSNVFTLLKCKRN
jgi:hypothetical protein